MSLTAARQTSVKNQIAIIDAQLAKANTTYESLLGQEVESYRFDSGEGSQQAKRRKLDALESSIEYLNIRREKLLQRLNCSGLVNINLDRRGGSRWR